MLQYLQFTGVTLRVWSFCLKSRKRTSGHAAVNHRRRHSRELVGALHRVLGGWHNRMDKDSTGKAFHGRGQRTNWSLRSRFTKLPC